VLIASKLMKRDGQMWAAISPGSTALATRGDFVYAAAKVKNSRVE